MDITSRTVLPGGGASGPDLAPTQRMADASTVVVGRPLTRAPSRSTHRRVASTRPSSICVDVARA